MVCDPRSRVHLKCPTLSTAYSRSITHHVWHSTPAIRSSRPSRRSARSGRRIADRRCVAAGGGAGESAGLVLADEASQGGCSPYGVRSTELCPPEKLNRVAHTAGVTTHPVCTTRPTPRVPLAPCDPASGSRTGGALRGGGEGAREGTGLVLADGARVPSLRAIRPADRGPAVRAAADGGRGRGKHRSRDVAPYGGATHEAVFS